MPEDSRQPIIRFENVTVSFEGDVALRNLSFEAFEGESRVILGAAGSGKTVLLKTALGLVKPDAGKVYRKLCAKRRSSGESTKNHAQNEKLRIVSRRNTPFSEPIRKSAAETSIRAGSI